MRLNDINSFWPGGYEQFLKCRLRGAPPAAAVSPKKLTKIYCEVNKSSGVKSRVILDKTSLLQVKSI